MTSGVAIVTGASRGLGRAFSEALLKRGHKVFLCCIDNEEGTKTLSDLRNKYGEDRVDFQYCDVRNENELTDVFNNAIKKHNRVNIMVNNAGIMDEKQVKNTIDINLTGMICGSMLALNHMKQHRSGLIVNVSSIAGLIPVSFCPAYVASKHGIVAYTRSWALHPEVRRNGVRMTCLCPSFTNTDIIKNPSGRVEGIALAKKVIAMYDIMPIERVTEAFLKLLDDDSNNGKVMVATPNFMDYNTFHESNL